MHIGLLETVLCWPFVSDKGAVYIYQFPCDIPSNGVEMVIKYGIEGKKLTDFQDG